MSTGGSKGSAVAQPVGQQVIQQKSEPWEGQKPLLQYGFGQASHLYQNNPQSYYPNATYVPASNQTTDALASAENRARTGSPLQAAGNEQMLSTIRGDYLDPGKNPWLRSTYEAAADPMVRAYRDTVLPGVDANYVKAGRYGSGLYQNTKANTEAELARGLRDLGTQIYGGNYQAERGRQSEAVGQAPAYAAQDYNDAARLMSIGQTREGYAGQQLQDSINRFNYSQAEPWSRLGNYMSLIQGDYGRTGTTTQPIYGAQSQGFGLGDALGILGTGASIAGSVAPFFSSKKLKDKWTEPEFEKMPEKVANVGASVWSYKGDGQKHMGPMAEDFAKEFGVGDGMTLNPVDMFGVMMAANKGLTERIRKLEGRRKMSGGAPDMPMMGA